MLQVRGDVDLGEEAVRAEHCAKLRTQHLQGDTAPVPESLEHGRTGVGPPASRSAL
jgi:hypothetical protein